MCIMNITRWIRPAIFGFVFSALLAAGCSEKQPGPGEVVARVGDKLLLREVVVQLIPENLSGTEREYFIKQIVEEWVDSHTFAAAALSEGLSLNARDAWQVERLEAEMLSNYFLTQKLRGNPHVTDEEIEDYYKDNPAQFRRNQDEAHLIHLYFEQLDKTLVREIRNSENLMTIIESNYLDMQITRAAEPNGDLGYISMETLRPEFRKKLRIIKTGKIYGPIKTGAGYHYLQLIDFQKAGTQRGLALASDEIRNILQVSKRKAQTRALRVETRKEYNAETFYENIL